MTRGNQRDIDRVRAQSRLAAAQKSAHSRASHKDQDASIMREKQKLAEMKKQGAPPDGKAAPQGKDNNNQAKKK